MGSVKQAMKKNGRGCVWGSAFFLSPRDDELFQGSGGRDDELRAPPWTRTTLKPDSLPNSSAPFGFGLRHAARSDVGRPVQCCARHEAVRTLTLFSLSCFHASAFARRHCRHSLARRTVLFAQHAFPHVHWDTESCLTGGEGGERQPALLQPVMNAQSQLAAS